MQHFACLLLILVNCVLSLNFSVRNNFKINFIYGLIKITFSKFKFFNLIIFSHHEAKAYALDEFYSVLSNPNFNRDKTTTIYSYGFTQTLFNPSVREVVDAYLFNGNFNLMVISCDNVFAYNVLVSIC